MPTVQPLDISKQTHGEDDRAIQGTQTFTTFSSKINMITQYSISVDQHTTLNLPRVSASIARRIIITESHEPVYI